MECAAFFVKAVYGLSSFFVKEKNRHGFEAVGGSFDVRLVEQAFDHLARYEADGFLRFHTVFECDERRDRLHAELDGKFGLLVNVDFADLEVGTRCSHLVDDGREHTAGTAPRRPEVEQHCALGVCNFMLEVFLCNLYRSHSIPSQSFYDSLHPSAL